MTYLLDTNVCIALINGKPAGVRTGLEKAVNKGSGVFASSIAVYELWYGVWKSLQHDVNAKRVRTFLSGPIRILAFDGDDAEVAASVRADLEKMGKPIGPYDLLIAGQALRHKMTLVTANTSEFVRVKGLAWEDWGRS